VCAVFGGAFVFGWYLVALAWIDLNHDQAFAALGLQALRAHARARRWGRLSIRG